MYKCINIKCKCINVFLLKVVFSLFSSKLSHNSWVPNKHLLSLDNLPISFQPPETYLDISLSPPINLYWFKVEDFLKIFIKVLGQDKFRSCYVFTARNFYSKGYLKIYSFFEDANHYYFSLGCYLKTQWVLYVLKHNGFCMFWNTMTLIFLYLFNTTCNQVTSRVAEQLKT